MVIIVLGILLLLFIVIVPAAPLWARLGVKPLCVQGDWPNLRIVSCPETPSALTPLPLPSLIGQKPLPIIVDDDGSPDGTIALLFFLNNPRFNVRAVTISEGEAHPDLFAPHILQLMAGLGAAHIPVGAGRATPIEGNNAFPDPWRQASDSFWDIDLSPAMVTQDPSSAAELMVQTINNSPQPVVIFISGTHTNLAEALRLDPGIRENIGDVYIMGGSIYGPGNIHSDWPEYANEVAEWNIWVDPVAAAEVFSSGLILHLVPLDATQQVVWAKSDLPTWNSADQSGSKVAGDLLQWMLDSWSEEGVYIWDLVAAVQATNPAACPEVPLSVNIITTTGAEQGRTMVRDGSPNAGVCLEPDAGQVKAIAASIFGGR